MSAELAAIAADPSIIERAADPGVFVMEACERGKTWLRQALDLGDIDQIAEIKSTAEAIRIYTISKNYSEDAKVSATELVRRAEGGLGRATRKGQEDDWIRGKGETTDLTSSGTLILTIPGFQTGLNQENTSAMAKLALIRTPWSTASAKRPLRKSSPRLKRKGICRVPTLPGRPGPGPTAEPGPTADLSQRRPTTTAAVGHGADVHPADR